MSTGAQGSTAEVGGEQGEWRAPVIPETSGFDDAERLSAIEDGVPVVVRGVLYSDFRGWRLCNVIDESAPPQCGLEIWLDLPRGLDPSTVGEQSEMEDSITGSDVPIVLGEHVAAVGILTAPDRLEVASLVVDEELPVGRPGRVAGGSIPASEDRLEALGVELTGIGFQLRRDGSTDVLAQVLHAGPLDGALYVLVTAADDRLVEALESFAPDVPLLIASVAEPA